MLKLRMFLLVLAVALIPLGGVLADTTDRADLCGDLPATDCQILIDNESVMNSLNAFAFVMDMNLAASGAEPMQLAMRGGGAFSLSDEALQAVNKLSEGMSGAETAALIDLLLTSMTADVWFELQGSSGEEDIDVELNLQLKDGVLLIGAETLEALTGESMGGMESFGIDLNDALAELLEETGAIPATDLSDMEDAEAEAITVTRLPDGEVNGVAVAVFETDIDLDVFFSLVSAEQLVAASADLDDPEETQEMIDAIDVSEFYVRQYIGLDDSYTYRMKMALDISMDVEDLGYGAEAEVVMDMSIDLSDFGEPVAVEIPEDAFVFPLAMLLAMSNQQG